MKIKAAASLAALMLGVGSTASATVIATTADLDFVVGKGSNLSALIFDFNQGPESSFAWGYRYDGSASGQDLLAAVSAADPNLSIDSTSFVTSVQYFNGTTTFSADADFGAGSVSWGYYLAGGFAGDDMLNNGAMDTPTPILGGGVELPSVFTISPSGASADSFGDSGRLLEDGSWDAWSFGPFDPDTFAHQTPPTASPLAATAVPEPSVTGILALSCLLVGLRRRR